MKKLIITLFVASSLSGCIETKRNTEYVGNVVKVTQSGVICPTWEVELIRTRGFINGVNSQTITTTAGREEFFTVQDSQVLKTLQDAMNNQQEVSVTTHSEFATFCRSDSHNQFADSVKLFH